MPSHGRAFTRRSLLRGAMHGAGLGLGLPLLDMFLNDHGTALASGAPLPVRYGTWFWGLGHTPGRGMTPGEGSDYQFIDECLALEPYRASYINYFSGFNVPLDGNASHVHYTGWLGQQAGSVPSKRGDVGRTFDTLIADQISSRTRFKSLEMSCTGNPIHSNSYRSAGNHNAAEVSPLQLYLRLFGAESASQADGDRGPDPRILLRKSVLSAVGDDRQRLVKAVGSNDRRRLDDYFTSLRELEQQLELSLSAPPQMEACTTPEQPADLALGIEVDDVAVVHDAFAKLLALALACDQTRVFNLLYSEAASTVRVPGTTFTHHILSHEEPPDDNLGYQVQTAWFNEKSLQAFGRLLDEFARIQEGDGNLLDNLLMVAQTDTSDAKTHSVIGIPALSIGKAGGRIKTGMHVKGNASPISRIGLTAMQLMDVPVSEWGTRSLRTSSPIAEIIV
jgi:hypothetical protein